MILSLARLPWWFFFSLLLYLTDTGQIWSSTLKKIKLLCERLWAHGPYQYTKDGMLDSRKESAFKTTVVARYEQGLGVAFSAERATEADRQWHAVLTESETFAQGLNNFFSLWTTPKLCPESHLENFCSFRTQRFSGYTGCKPRLHRRCAVSLAVREMSEATETTKTLREHGLPRRENQ